MIGAIIGDIVGSKYEFGGIKTKDFPLFSDGCSYTDDTIMSVAVANALTESRETGNDFKKILVTEMQRLGRKYPFPQGGYGGHFSSWLNAENPQPYNSFGNGSAMRVSPCGYMAVELAEALSLAKASAEITHNHPEGIKGAQATAGAIFLAKSGKSKEEIKAFIEANFYNLDKTLDEIRPNYQFDESCQGTVPQAIEAFLESENFEDAIRNAVSLGGDSDTLAAITGGIAWAFYVPYYQTTDLDCWHGNEHDTYDRMMSYLPDDLQSSVNTFMNECIRRMGTYGRTGCCSPIPHTEDKTELLKYNLIPETITIDGEKTLKERFKEISKNDLINRLVSGEDFAHILYDLSIGIRNYNDYAKQINELDQHPELLNEATLEECLVFLTYCWRDFYWSGGNLCPSDKRREAIRNANMQIVNILFEEPVKDEKTTTF